MHGEVLVPLNASSSTIMVTARSLANPIRPLRISRKRAPVMGIGSAACLLLGRVVTSLLSS